MDLHRYLSESSTTAALAAKLGVPAPLVTQWKNGARSVPIDRAAQIDRATDGAVTRRDLRPDDWGDIWPELVDDEHPWIARGAAAKDAA